MIDELRTIWETSGRYKLKVQELTTEEHEFKKLEVKVKTLKSESL